MEIKGVSSVSHRERQKRKSTSPCLAEMEKQHCLFFCFAARTLSTFYCPPLPDVNKSWPTRDGSRRAHN